MCCLWTARTFNSTFKSIYIGIPTRELYFTAFIVQSVPVSTVNVDGPEGTYLSTHGERVAVHKDHVSWDLEMGDLTAPDEEQDNI